MVSGPPSTNATASSNEYVAWIFTVFHCMRRLCKAKFLTESMSCASTTATMMWSGPKTRSVTILMPSRSASGGIWLGLALSICRVCALEVGQRWGGCSAMTANCGMAHLWSWFRAHLTLLAAGVGRRRRRAPTRRRCGCASPLKAVTARCSLAPGTRAHRRVRRDGRRSGGLTRPYELDHVSERGDALDVEIGVEVVRIDEHRADAGGAGAVNIGARRVAHMDGVRGRHHQCLERHLEDARVRFGDTDHGRVEDRPHGRASSRTNLADGVVRQALLGVSVRVGHDR